MYHCYLLDCALKNTCREGISCTSLFANFGDITMKVGGDLIAGDIMPGYQIFKYFDFFGFRSGRTST